MAFAPTPLHTFGAFQPPRVSRFSVAGKLVFTEFELNSAWEPVAIFPLGSASMQTYQVRAHWDADAQVWWAESDDVPGLVAEARTHDELVDELRLLVPELLQINMPDRPHGRIMLRLVSEQVEDICYA